jgi:ribonuclease-3
LANKLGLAPYLIISYHVEFGCHGRINKRILENTFEAFIGAMFMDFSNLKDVPNYAYGYEVVRRFVITAIEKYVDIVEMIMKDDNYKDSLMWFFQKNFSGAYPIYNKEKFENECFHVMVKEPNSNNVVGRGSARSKKQAEQRAAKSALQYYAKKNMTQAPQ